MPTQDLFVGYRRQCYRTNTPSPPKQLELTLTRRRRSTNDDVDYGDGVRPQEKPLVVLG